MAYLKQKDIKEIIEFFDKELNTLSKVSKVDKMKMRSRVVKVLKPVLSAGNPRARAVLEIVEDNLKDVLKQFRDSYTFKRKLLELLREKLEGRK